MNRIRKIYGIFSFLSLIFGIVIYFLFRDLNNMALFAWIPKPEFIGTVLVPLKPSALANFLKYHLPDMLWFLSGILLFRFIWFDKIKIQKIYILCFCGIGVIIETSQLLKNVPGTFDWLDLLFMGIVAYVESLLYKKFNYNMKIQP